MKKILYIVTLMAVLLSCEDKLDITPKGQTVLNTVADLETLLNQEYSIGTPSSDLGVICNETYGLFSNVNNTLSNRNTLAYAHLTYDPEVDRKSLTTKDDLYNALYRYINYMNVILDKIDDAEGDESRKPRIIAEAHIMRVYLHWLAVNIYARQYDEATAAETGGIAYVTDIDVTAQKSKMPLNEVYRLLLEDCAEEYIAVLPDVAPDVVRAGKAWGYAVRAKVLMQMKRYGDALRCALKSLEYNGTIEDRAVVNGASDWNLPKFSPNNLIYIGGMVAPTGEVLSRETTGLFETGDYIKDYSNTAAGGGWEDDDEEEWDEYALEDDEEWDEDGEFTADVSLWSSMMGEMMSGVPGSVYYSGWSAFVNMYGITAERMYYTAAECYLRTGQIGDGLALVDRVRRCRIHPDDFTAFEGQASTEEAAMALLQRAKWIECISSYENFFDCKRWNTEPAYLRTIVRTLPDIGTYTLKPDSPLWVFPFPADAVRYNSSLTPNY